MLTPAAFEPPGKAPPRGERRLRFFSIRHARMMETLYGAFEPLLTRLHPAFAWIGYDRLERPAAAVERAVKGALFDCRMCGQCVLSSTGMSCPMNCPKNLRNGPCGGVRQDGGCEVYPDMPCVWVKAWEGSRLMRAGDAIAAPQPPIDHRRKGESSWLRVARETNGAAPPAPSAH
ncbi:methylenetetrahydrofolate reductase C-terminal domain-containing protein [Alsobacter sp. KACC 23698]|uniref:Methylenetetrahydrofolate reductase C-terminal domain-containing protein n=1 Tax=Alsobacter sp. KACC 23698 TaxID=3149229 RepID=A0AAU7JCA9_9HYPH